MEKMNEKEIKERLVNLLCRFDELCRINNLKYSLGYGTLLGAARHKGFIPWDDDIDVIMPQDDYLKFLQLDCFNHQEINSDISLYEIDNESTHDLVYLYPFAKLMDNRTLVKADIFREVGGLWIDIFPITGLPQNETEIKEHFKKLDKDHRLLAAAHRYRNLRKCSIIDFVKQLRCNFYYMRSERIVRRMKKTVFSYEYDLSGRAANAIWGYGIKEVLSRDIFEDYIELEFEGRHFSALKHYDEFLTKIYGDWRVLPPEEKRVGHHYYDAYIK